MEERSRLIECSSICDFRGKYFSSKVPPFFIDVFFSTQAPVVLSYGPGPERCLVGHGNIILSRLNILCIQYCIFQGDIHSFPTTIKPNNCT